MLFSFLIKLPKALTAIQNFNVLNQTLNEVIVYFSQIQVYG